jgi:hypothetical protein
MTGKFIDFYPRELPRCHFRANAEAGEMEKEEGRGFGG